MSNDYYVRVVLDSDYPHYCCDVLWPRHQSEWISDRNGGYWRKRTYGGEPELLEGHPLSEWVSDRFGAVKERVKALMKWGEYSNGFHALVLDKMVKEIPQEVGLQWKYRSAANAGQHQTLCDAVFWGVRDELNKRKASGVVILMLGDKVWGVVHADHFELKKHFDNGGVTSAC